MKSFFQLAPSDGPSVGSLLREFDPAGKWRLKEPYACTACAACGKPDEAAILSAGLTEPVRIRSRRDIILSDDDDFLLFSERARDRFVDGGLTGVDFLPVPGSPNWSIAWPKSVAAVTSAADGAVPGMERYGLCAACGRYRETCGIPILTALTLPDDPRVVSTPAVPLESRIGRRSAFLASFRAKQVFSAGQLKGLDWSCLD